MIPKLNILKKHVSAPTILHMMSEASHLLEAHLASQGTGDQLSVTAPPPHSPACQHHHPGPPW